MPLGWHAAVISEADTEKSDQGDTTDRAPTLSLEQIMSRLHHLAAMVAPSHELGNQPRQPPAPSEDARAPAEPLREHAAEKVEPEPNHGHLSGETTEPEVVVGSLLTMQEDRVRLVEHRKLCQECLTSEHSEAAESCHCKEPEQSQVLTEVPPVPPQAPPVST
jgi:hypothetical protein